MWNDPLTDSVFITNMWREADDIDPSTLTSLLAIANEACAAYAPALPASGVPASWKLAEIFQARHIWSQAGGGNAEEIGADGLAVPVYPLIFAARDLLRPKTSPLGRLR